LLNTKCAMCNKIRRYACSVKGYALRVEPFDLILKFKYSYGASIFTGSMEC